MAIANKSLARTFRYERASFIGKVLPMAIANKSLARTFRYERAERGREGSGWRQSERGRGKRAVGGG